MSNLGNIEKTLGKQFDIVVANTEGVNVESALGLPEQVLIIAAPQNNGEDAGIYTLFVTDSNGNPIRLTYNIVEGNGIEIDGDNVRFHIDGSTITTSEGELVFDIENLVDNKTIYFNNGIKVNAEKLDKASASKYGVIKLDNNTLKNDQDGRVYVDTDNLDYANNSVLGIVFADYNTIYSADGSLYVITENLTHTNDGEYGVCSCDNKTIISKDGMLVVNTDGLTVSDIKTPGVSKCDGKTITSNGGVYHVETKNLPHATEKEFGTVKPDNETLMVKDGMLFVEGYERTYKDCAKLTEKMAELTNKINEIKTKIETGDIKQKSEPDKKEDPKPVEFTSNVIQFKGVKK